VKSGATAEAATELGAALPAGTVVLSLQNGISNAAAASNAAPGLKVLPSMVPYNIAELAPGAFLAGRPAAHVGRTRRLEALAGHLREGGVPLDLVADLRAIQWGKLLINLNNPVNALSGMPLREELLQHGYRRCFGGAHGGGDRRVAGGRKSTPRR
jgi:2-dehydropantoate 2-reductase